jgi:hypothetical protein
MANPATNKPNTDRLCGTCSTTGKSYRNLTASQRTQIASVKTLLMVWLGSNVEWEGTETLAIGKRAFDALGELIRADKFPAPVPVTASKFADGTDPPLEPKGKNT